MIIRWFPIQMASMRRRSVKEKENCRDIAACIFFLGRLRLKSEQLCIMKTINHILPFMTARRCLVRVRLTTSFLCNTIFLGNLVRYESVLELNRSRSVRTTCTVSLLL